MFFTDCEKSGNEANETGTFLFNWEECSCDYFDYILKNSCLLTNTIYL